MLKPLYIIAIFIILVCAGLTAINMTGRTEAMPKTVADHRIELITQEGIRDPAYGTTFYVSVLNYRGKIFLANSKGGVCQAR